MANRCTCRIQRNISITHLNPPSPRFEPANTTDFAIGDIVETQVVVQCVALKGGTAKLLVSFVGLTVLDDSFRKVRNMIYRTQYMLTIRSLTGCNEKKTEGTYASQ